MRTVPLFQTASLLQRSTVRTRTLIRGWHTFDDRDIITNFPLFLQDLAIAVYDTLSADLKNDLESLVRNFKAYFGKTELDYVFADETVFTQVQRPNEKSRDYISQMQKLAKRVPHLQDEILHWVIIRGLHPLIKASITAQKCDLMSFADILESAKVAELAGLGEDDDWSDATKINQLMQEVSAGREEVQQLTAKMANMSLSVAQPRSPTPKRRQQRVSFKNKSVHGQHNATRLHRHTQRFVVLGEHSISTTAASLVRQVRRFSFVTIVVVIVG